MDVADALHTLRVLGRAGVLRPTRPDRLVRAGLAARHYGMNLAAAFPSSAARFGDRIAIVDERGTLTYTELERRSNAVAHGLLAEGIGEGDTVAVMCRNHRGFVETTAALAKIGADALYLNTGFAGPQLREVATSNGATVVIHDEEFTELVTDGGPSRRIVSWGDGDGDKHPSLDDLIQTHPGSPPPAPSRPGHTVILTSGTTGTPKGAVRKQSSTLGAGISLLDRIPYRSGETSVIAAPLFHSWGFGNLSIGVILGNTAVLERRFDPESTLAAIAHHRAAVLAAVPVMLQRILELPPEVRRRYDTSSLRIAPLSGSAIPGRLAPRFMEEFGDCVYNLYGSTEIGWATIATPGELWRAPGTAGRPPRGTVVEILDAHGAPVPTGETGGIFVRNEVHFVGYADGGTKPMVGELMSTGDKGHFDASGLLFVDGREDEMIVSGGENVYPREVEELLELHPDIAEAAVVGVDDDEFGQRLKAYVVARPGSVLTAEAVRDHVKQSLARFKVPRDVELVDTLPRNPTGKVVKRELA